MHKSLLENVAGICVEHHAMPRQFPVSPSLTHPHNICDLPSSVWNCICKKRRVHLQICTNSVAEHLGAPIGILGWNFRSNNLRISKVRHETRNNFLHINVPIPYCDSLSPLLFIWAPLCCTLPLTINFYYYYYFYMVFNNSKCQIWFKLIYISSTWKGTC
jgi:hypothetical protein